MVVSVEDSFVRADKVIMMILRFEASVHISIA